MPVVRRVTEAIRQALIERKSRLQFHVTSAGRPERIRRFLEREVWPQVPAKEKGRRLTKKQEADILGYGKDGF